MIYIRSIPSINLPVNTHFLTVIFKAIVSSWIIMSIFQLSLVSISETLGDIATVCNDTVLRLHTINATLIGSVNMKERITAMCFSTAPEGVSVNVLATGLETGVIKWVIVFHLSVSVGQMCSCTSFQIIFYCRLWSTWDLSPVTDIINTSISCPIIRWVAIVTGVLFLYVIVVWIINGDYDFSLTYSFDSQHLYGSVSDGNVYIWEAVSSSGAIKTPKFLNLTAVNWT